jgi:hypothetical protein
MQEVPGLNLGQGTSFPEVSRGFPKAFKANAGKVS